MTSLIMPTRRGFLVGLGTGIALLSAPAIVRASSIMPVVPIPKPQYRVGYHRVSVLRSDMVLEVSVDGDPVDFELHDYGRMIAAKEPKHGGLIRIPMPPIGSFNTDILKVVRRVD